jgi:hypothetical protein
MAGFVLFSPLFENGKMLLGARLKLKEITYVRVAQLVALIGLLVWFGSEGLWAIGLAVSMVTTLGYALLMLYVGKEVNLRAADVFRFPLLAGCALAGPLLLFNMWMSPYLSAGSTIEVSLLRVVIFLIVLPAIMLGLEALIARDRLTRYISAVRSRM